MKTILNVCLVALAACIFSGCATSSVEAVKGGPTASCPVCRYNNDLACVCVKVDDSTPRAEYQGTTYYFCSDDCRTAFLGKPQKYLPRAEARQGQSEVLQ